MPQYFEFEISLMHIKPRIWRRFLLAVDGTTFCDLHEAIQDADTWTDSHMWQFRAPGRRGDVIAGMPADEEMGFDDFGHDDPPAHEVLLSQFFNRKGQKCTYDYDFGDGWEHQIQLKQMLELPQTFYRRITAGKRAFPMEDCGGEWGYYACVAATNPNAQAKMDLPDLDPDEIEERREWVGNWDSEEFDLEKVKVWFDANSYQDLRKRQQAAMDMELDDDEEEFEPDTAGRINPSNN